MRKGKGKNQAVGVALSSVKQNFSCWSWGLCKPSDCDRDVGGGLAIFIGSGEKRRNDMPIYSETLFFKLYIYDILHVQICLLKIMGIHLNTLELHWARPWLHVAGFRTRSLLEHKVFFWLLVTDRQAEHKGKQMRACISFVFSSPKECCPIVWLWLQVPNSHCLQ